MKIIYTKEQKEVLDTYDKNITELLKMKDKRAAEVLISLKVKLLKSIIPKGMKLSHNEMLGLVFNDKTKLNNVTYVEK